MPAIDKSTCPGIEKFSGARIAIPAVCTAISQIGYFLFSEVPDITAGRYHFALAEKPGKTFMSLSLREQLLQAGLVTKKQAEKAERQQVKPKRKGQPPPPLTEEQIAVRKAYADKAARDQELNRQKREKAEGKARRAEIRQIVEQHRIPRVESEDYFNFVDGNKVHRFAVDAQIRERLRRGELAIARHNGFYALVPLEIAERIREKDASMLVPLKASADQLAADDPYKDFAVPDDLMW